MLRHMTVAGSLLGALVMALPPTPAQAQWLPVSDPCTTCITPVVQPCYRTVPVTEYRQVRRVVQKPVCETKYVDQQVTAYKPVTETRVANVPTVSYEDVTEARTVYRDCGYWRTSYQCVNLPSPCEYDPRPDVFGWLNRTAYSIGATFTPRTIARREYVPQTVAQTIPVTRRVAHQGVKQVNYQVTRMVPYTTTRKVAVNTVRYVAQEVTDTHPVTVWRSVPIGSTIAYSTTPATTVSETVLAPSPDPIGTASDPSNKTRSASQDDEFDERSTQPSSSLNYDRDSTRFDPKLDGFEIRSRTGQSTQLAGRTSIAGKFTRPTRGVPSAVRAGRWTSRREPVESNGPAMIAPTTAVAQASTR